MHPVLAIALGDSDEVIVRVPVSPGSFLDGRTLAEAQLELETGYYLLAIRRAGRYLYRPAWPGAAPGGRRADRDRARRRARASRRARRLPRARRRRHRRDRPRPGRLLDPDARPVTAPLTSGETALPASQPPDFETPPTGLTAAEVQERVARGAVNDTGERTSRTVRRDRPGERLHPVQRDPRRDARGHRGGRADPGRDVRARPLRQRARSASSRSSRAKRTLDQLAVLERAAGARRPRRRRCRRSRSSRS